MSPDIDGWIAEKRSQSFESTMITLDELTEPGGWRFAPETGNLEHDSGRFFTVEGMHVRANHGHTREWQQPILVQRDIAILGIIAKEFDGVLHFLLQAKMEPGNADMVQLSPTVQATSSNYTRAHRGRGARYVEYFTEPRGRVLVDVLQSEQGAWFHLKRNRNVVIEVTDDVPVHDDFCWLTLGQISRLLRRRNVINMDARTVLAGLPIASPASGPNGFAGARGHSSEPGGAHTMTEILSWFTGRKSDYELSARLVPLNSLTGWRRDAERIFAVDGGPFSIVGVRVNARTREVHSWKQPLLAPNGLALAALVVRRIDGVLHALVRAEVLPGYRDTVELGPTVRFMMNDHAATPADRRPEFLDYVLSARETVRYDVVLSEEGGRFLRAETRYLIVEAGDDLPPTAPPDFMWITVGQLMALQRHSYYLAIEARTLLLCLNNL
jgi:NDP-hexose 2,3-dehydratase